MERTREIVIVTGMSGAGKSTVLKFLEDIGFYCADNLPPALIPRFAEVCFGAGPAYDRLALGIDIRGGGFFDDLSPALGEISRESCAVTILYLDADDETLLRRFKETRRSHPLAGSWRLTDSIREERRLTQSVKDSATYVLDTSGILARELKSEINDIFLAGKAFAGIVVNVVSFGFKYGLPMDADIVFDVRFMPNPFYIPELRPLTGNDPEIREFVLSHTAAALFLDKTASMFDALIPHYLAEGKTRLVICIGCTGGRHRSVTLSDCLYQHIKAQGYSVFLKHRDLEIGTES